MVNGLVLGKFLPPHKGHEFLINFAKSKSDKLFVVVDNIADDVIPVKTRMQWMKKICSEAEVLTLNKTLPQFPNEAEDFWQQWEKGLKDILPEKVDFVFASENYGEKLAQVLSAVFVPVDIERKNVNISATQIRKSCYKHWDYISDAAKPYFAKKVCVFGPESTGKSTLTKQLAEYFNTCYVEEYARTLIENNRGNIEYCDISEIAQGHNREINTKINDANKILFVDTDAITTKIWSIELFGRYPEVIDDIILQADYDLYLLLDVDLPWVKDTVRYFPENRKEFFEKCESELKKYGKKYKIINGEGEERLKNAVKAVIEESCVW